MRTQHALRAADPSLTPAAPPPSTSDLIEEISAEEKRLAALLAEVLDRRPQGRLASADIAGADVAGSDTPTGLASAEPDDADGFRWRPEIAAVAAATASQPRKRDRSLDDSDPGDNLPLMSTRQWLERARRTKRWNMARRLGAWALTAAVGGGIIAVAAYLVTGRTLDLAALIAAGAARILF
jgi:hypothetical protein